MNKTSMLTALAAVSLIALGACSSGGTAAPVVTVTQSTAPVPSFTETQTPEPEPTGTVDTTDKTAETFVMPGLVGKNLQVAQDILQSKGSYVLDQTDASGLGRVQVLDSNWKVCKQSPAPGKKVATDALVTLASVKLDESC